MSTPTDPPLDELRTLRERAYGRDADIQDDPDALARLRELEAQASAAMPSVPMGSATPDGVAPGAAAGDVSGRLPPDDATDAAAPRTGTTTVGAAVGPAMAVDTGPTVTSTAVAADGGELAAAETAASATAHDDESLADDGDSARHGTPPRSPWWRRRTPLLWAASVAVGVLFGVGLTLAVQAAGAGRVATLNEDPDAEWPSQFFGERPADSVVFDDFHGLTVLTFRQPAQPGSSQTCLYVVTAPDAFGAGTCAADAFAPTTSLEVGPDSPEALSDRFPRGTALQFVLEGSNVQIYAREPRLVEPTP